MNNQGPSPYYTTSPPSTKSKPNDYVPEVQMGGNGNKHGNMFQESQWRDTWAAVLFYIHLAITAAISAYSLHNLATRQDFGSGAPSNGGAGPDPNLIKHMVAILFGSVGFSALLTVGFLGLLMSIPETMIVGMFLGSAVLYAIAGVAALAGINGGLAMGIVLLVIAAFHVLLLFLWRRFLKFSAALLKTVVSVIRTYPATVGLSFSSLAVSVILSVPILFACIDRLSTQSGLAITLGVYLVFSFYWTSQVVQNVTHTTNCGVFATFYFMYGSGHAIISPTLASLKRAMTCSFGSVALGSLIIAAIQTLRFIVSMISDDRNSLFAAIADCFLSCIESLAEAFNYYAYVQVAIYGKPFVQAGRDTWRLILDRGINIIINENLVGTCLGMGSFLIGILTGCVSFAMCAMTIKSNLDYSIGISVGAGVLGLFVSSVACSVVHSGIVTTFVCLAEDPEALRRTKPDLYREIQAAYTNLNL